jgi:glycosyl transferase family 2
MTADGVSVVVPTLGRPSLTTLLQALTGTCPIPVEVLVVDDRADRRVPLALPAHVTVLPGRARGPAAARNTGWRAARHDWVAFLDDDVRPDPGWLRRLAEDLAAATQPVGGVQGNLHVPAPPAGRRRTDWERVTAGLSTGDWITADMAYRRAALTRCGGFDERLPRAFREDAELAHRVRQAGWSLRRGTRSVTHPVRPENRWVSLRAQRGNADDALLRRLYGPGWRDRLAVPPGRRHRHAAVTAAAAAALTCGCAAWLAQARRRTWTVGAAVAGVAWLAGTAEFAATRIIPGPRDRSEVTTMLVTSAAIPPLAVAHWLRGWLRWRGAVPLSGSGGSAGAPVAPVATVASAASVASPARVGPDRAFSDQGLPDRPAGDRAVR